jgi:hypothetical protein
MGDLMKVEILHLRDPDSACDVVVYIDGVAIEATSFVDIDPGHGYERSEWVEDREHHASDASYSEAFRMAVLGAHDIAATSKYIED